MSSYLGRGIDQIDNISTLDNLSFNGSLQTFNLTQNSVAFVPVSADALQIQIDGVIQSGNYTVSGSTVTFDFTPSGSSVCNGIRHYGVGIITQPSDGSVNMAQLGASGTKSSSTFLAGDNSFKSLTTNATHTGEVTGSGALTVADNIIDEANLKVSNSPTNGYMLTSQSGASGGLTWAEPSGGAMVLLQSVSVTSTVSVVNFNSVFSSTYTNYFFVFWNVLNGINNVPFHLRFKDTSNNSLTASVYDYVNWGSNTSGSTVVDHASDSSTIVLANNLSHSGPTSGKASFTGVIYAPRVTTYASSLNRPTINWQSAYARGGILYTNQSSGVFDNGTQVGGIQVYGDNGGGPSTYTDRFEGKIYGIVDS